MDNNPQANMDDDKIACFDRVFCSNHIRMLKILLHYIPGVFRRQLTVYIKFLELQQVLSHPCEFPPSDFRSFETDQTDCSESSTVDFSAMIGELLPFCDSGERIRFQNMENMFRSFEQMKNMMEMVQMMQEMKEMFGGEDGGFNPDILAGMMGQSAPGGFQPDILAAMMQNDLFGST